MKTEKLTKKLSLNKKTIAHLGKSAMNFVQGGCPDCTCCNCPSINMATCNTCVSCAPCEPDTYDTCNVYMCTQDNRYACV